MTFTRRRTTAGVFLLAALSGLGLLPLRDAHAQDTLSSTPPVYTNIGQQNVDLGTGAFTMTVQEVAIGQPGAGGLTYGRSFIGTGWRSNLDGGINKSGTTYTVSIGASSEAFTSGDGVNFSNAGGGASTLSVSGNAYTYTMADGTVAIFDKGYCCNIGGQGTASPASEGRITTMTLPTGEVRTWTYVVANFSVPNAPSGTYKALGRLQSVSNNFGYQIRFKYATDAVGSVNSVSPWMTVTQVVGFNMAAESCGVASYSCSLPAASWPTTSYSVNSSNATVTDGLGRSVVYTYSSGKITAIRFPSSGTDNITIGYDSSNRVSSVNNGAGTWTYSYSDSGTTRTTTVKDPLGNQRVVTTDLTTGQMQTDQDALGHTTTYTYDGSHRLTRVTAPEGGYVTYDYDGRGNITKTTKYGKPGTNLVVWSESTFEAGCSNPKTCNKPSGSHDDNGHWTYYSYDPNHGGVLTVTRAAPSNGAAQPQVRYSYGSYQARYMLGGGTWVSGSSIYLPTGSSTCLSGSSCAGSALEAKTSIGYGDTSQPNNLLPVSVTQSAGDNSVSAATSFTYDMIGNRLTVTGPANTGTTRYSYDAGRRVVGVVSGVPGTSGGYRAVVTAYNGYGQVNDVRLGTANGDGSNFVMQQHQKITYDSQGRKTREALVDPQNDNNELVATAYAYDGASRLQTVTRPMNGNGADRVTTYAYDAVGRVTQTWGDGTKTTSIAAISYTNDGLQSSVMDGNGNVTNYSYDGYDRVSQVSYPSVNGASSYETFTYDNASVVQSHRLRDGQTINFGIDALERVTSRDVGGFVYSYDNLGHVTQMSASGDATVAMTYDALGRVTSQATGNRTVSAQYDAAGRLTKLTWPDNFSVTYGYDASGAMTTVTDSTGTQLMTYAYDDLGRRKTATRSNGVTTSYGFDILSRLTSQNFSGTSANLNLSFGYNAAGQITSRGGDNAAYDPPLPENGTTNQAINALNQTTQVSGNVPTNAIAYDGRGNVSTYGTTALGYNADNQLTSVSPATTLGYDAAGRLAQVNQSSTTNFLYFGNRLLAEYDGAGNVQRRYVPGAATDETIVWYEGSGTGDRRWLMPDERGSIVAVTNDGGSVLTINTYDEYGRPGANNKGRFQYTGQIWLSEIGAYHFKARVYIPSLGKFAQADPSGYSAGMNLYAYAGGDPINNIDPSGLSCVTGVKTTADQNGNLLSMEFIITADCGPSVPHVTPADPTYYQPAPIQYNPPPVTLGLGGGVAGNSSPQSMQPPDHRIPCSDPEKRTMAIANGLDNASDFFQHVGLATGAGAVVAALVPGLEETAPGWASASIGSFKVATGLSLTADGVRFAGGFPEYLELDKFAGNVASKWIPGTGSTINAFREMVSNEISNKLKESIAFSCKGG
ncbi:YD repeat protein [Nitrospirillum viridazoti Y2]|uniref:RHS repeat-associated protein n=1 Tax=Nitrospirillum amazonense TaxID=28077 RepID=A0A560HPV9_9PROT|nr:RHS repeat-associated core domain-containing protein [Nitrospirillum amazonense]EGY02316.1 YD repeat protein [Nitrospirillum amazonense Y2]TWB47529.1 RHS repeat-associated protein [Nitrospirillum amazonense]